MTDTHAPQKLRFYFRKESGARFLSHLDLMATLEYSLRRATLPLELSEGFSPRPKVSLAAPLAVGYTGRREILEIGLREHLDPVDVMTRLQAVLPRGIVLTEVEALAPSSGKGAASRITGAEYTVTVMQPEVELPQRVADLLSRERIDQAEEREGTTRTRNVRPFIQSIEAPNDRTLRLYLTMGDAGSVRPETVLDLLNISRDGARICRDRIDFQ